MKKTMAFLLAGLLILSLLAACGAGAASEPEAASAAAASEPETTEAAAEEPAAEFKTMGDVFAYPSDNNASGDNYIIYVFEKDGVIYRAMTEFPPEVVEVVSALDIMDEQYSEKVRAAAAPLEITKLENLTEMIPSQEELDKLAGKTGQELLDDGWTIWRWEDDAVEYGMYHGPFSFAVTFDRTADAMNEMGEPDIAPLTVKSVTCEGVGDATNVEFP